MNLKYLNKIIWSRNDLIIIRMIIEVALRILDIDCYINGKYLIDYKYNTI